MTSEIKTNEFLRRRKIRLQQVREQSKDIAKKIRLRANHDKLRQIDELEAKREYLEHQDKFVKKLETLYAQRLENVGASHENASRENNKDNLKNKSSDVSKARGKEAAAELRRQKQEKLDEHKKLLDRKLHARKVANTISREKLTVSKSKAPNLNLMEEIDKPFQEHEKVVGETNAITSGEKDDKPMTSDMATQWDSERLPNERIPEVPSLDLQKNNSNKPLSENMLNCEKSGRVDLFALSDEMPSSLRGGATTVYDEEPHNKPSLTMVSEFLQNRSLRLREPEPTSTTTSRKQNMDLHSIRQTILRTRASVSKVKNTTEKPTVSSTDIGLGKKKSVTIYNHSTKDTRDVPQREKAFVSRDMQPDEDAYSNAMKEVSIDNSIALDDNRIKEVRSKIALTKQTVEKEFKDTMTFLNSLPRDNTPIRKAFMDKSRQEQLLQTKQNQMQQEYKKIEKDCKKHRCRINNRKPQVSARSKSKSPSGDKQEFISRNFQYSWMPVPESDNNLAIHTIPTTVKPGKSENVVKFSQVDSYHEYRSRHKHTPPTKDCSNNKESEMKEAATEDGTSDGSVGSDTSSVDNLNLGTENNDKEKYESDNSDSERIIIYKILDSQSRKRKTKKKSKLTNVISVDHVQENSHTNKTNHNKANLVIDQQLNEGIYKTVTEKGDNITNIYFSEDKHNKDPEKCSHYSQQDSENIQISGDSHVLKRKKSCSHCKNKEEGMSSKDNLVEPIALVPPNSATNSTTSFKTPQQSSNKTNHTFPGGHLNFIDDDSKENGKFYVGATGFVKDDDYEVVIQLRKKSTVQENNQKEEILKSGDLRNIDAKSKSENVSDAQPVIDDQSHSVEVGATELIEKQVKEKQSDTETRCNISQQSIQNLKSKECAVQVSDEALVPEPVSRPATSTYTQTSLSPTHRHGHFQMSSSTSTAYMSPPEFVRPKLFRRFDNHKHNHENEKDILNRYLLENEVTCHCKKCIKTHFVSNHYYEYNMTPPNTAKSNDHASQTSNTPKCRSSKCSKLKKNINLHQTKKEKVRNKSCSKKVKPKIFSTAKSFSVNSTKPTDKTKINPFLEKYIKKLLALSNEGVKTLEVANQECSSISTPGSSIINVKSNKHCKNPPLNQKISLEEIKRAWLQNRTLDNQQEEKSNSFNKYARTICREYYFRLLFPKISKKRSVHKIKSLNISKQIGRTKKNKTNPVFHSESSLNMSKSHYDSSSGSGGKSLTKTSPIKKIIKERKNEQHKKSQNDKEINRSEINNNQPSCNKATKKRYVLDSKPRAASSTESSRSGLENQVNSHNIRKIVSNVTESAAQVAGTEIHYLKFAEDKLQNIEKIADLTEKCTERLSNLAKVLKEVRKNKSSAYSQISASDSASESDQKSNQSKDIKNDSDKSSDLLGPTPTTCDKIRGPLVRENETSSVLKEDRKSKSSAYIQVSNSDLVSESYQRYNQSKDVKNNSDKSFELPAATPTTCDKIREPLVKENEASSFKSFVPLLSGIQLPKGLISEYNLDSDTKSSSMVASTADKETQKHKGKPPPALSRVHLKGSENCFTPHELSTVIETDSPMSVRAKNSNNNENDDNHSKSTSSSNLSENANSKSLGMDLRKFNEIMLKPFITINEFAKQCNIDALDEGSNFGDFCKDKFHNEELSSLHSDGSLPDVIAELLRRNIISEPFKFETASNVNSTSGSSDSLATMSILALSTVKKDSEKSKTTIKYKNKKHVAETSDTLSISSNPDLENAFKKLGMGWASSTLKKTKERLALSSSSNTSSSSISQFKLKMNKHELPGPVTDSVSSLTNASNSDRMKKGSNKNVEQQTLSQPITVKEFLRNELSKKITFNKSTINDTEPDFVSLFETRMPDDMRETSLAARDECSMESGNNRARTSTPVQVFKSNTYQSSSSSNKSNGLFSNADELSSVKMTSNSVKTHSTSDKDDLTIPNCSLRIRKGQLDSSKSD